MIRIVQYLSESIPRIGWREWVSFPKLNISNIKAKIDTGARTSVLHATSIFPFQLRGKEFIRFTIHPKHDTTPIVSEAAVIDKRYIADSSGHRELRYVIETHITLGELSWPIELTLSNRNTMLFRLLLGRTAIQNRFIVDPSHSFYHRTR